jgi:uncharacterized Ntn-hydrolase superfamily protein
VTYSIVARDEQSGAMGVACQSHFFAPGAVVTWAEPGVGVVATQAFVDGRYGQRSLAGLRAGRRPDQIVADLIRDDAHPEVRQFALVGRSGPAAVHTGAACIQSTGDLSAGGVAVQGNMLANDQVLPAMMDAFLQDQDITGPGGLARRLLRAMRAGEDAGGDARGSQGAVLVVVDGKPTDAPWDHKPIDLRVDDHVDPIGELERLLELRLAFDPVYQTMFAPGLMVGAYHEPVSGDLERTRETLERSIAVVEPNQEARFWLGILLARSGSTAEARKELRRCYAANPGLTVMTRRLVTAGILTEQEYEELQ